MSRATEAAMKAYPEDIWIDVNYYGFVPDPPKKDYNKERRAIYQQGYEQAEKDLGWVSVKDKLPKERGWYFTCINYNETPQALDVTYYDGKEWLDDDDSTENVDYWMEVPKLKK